MHNRDQYRKLRWAHAPLFHQPFWLDAVAPESWNAIILATDDDMTAYYLYAEKKTLTGLQVYMPPLTQILGPGYRLKDEPERELLNREMELLGKFCNALPKAASYESRWQTGYFNWLPFHWGGFHQRVRYTYVLNLPQQQDVLMENYSEKIRREIRKAGKTLTISATEDVMAFSQLVNKSLAGKKVKPGVDHHLLTRVFQACKENNCGKIWCAKDASENLIAAVFIAWDAHTAYYIIGAREENTGNSGAMSFLFHHAFYEVKDKVQQFDFEGSMLQGVENYFRSFGAAQKMYFEITRTRSLLLKIKNGLKALRR